MTAPPIQLNRRRRRILLVLLTDAAHLSGVPLMRAAQVASGSMHPFLARLEKQGLVESWWWDRDDGLRLRCYQLTPRGRTWAAETLGLEMPHDPFDT